MRAQMNAGKIGDSDKIPMLQRLLRYRYSTNNELMPDHDIISECMGHMYADLSVSLFLTDTSHVRPFLGLPAPILHPPRYRTSFGSSAAVRIS